MTAIKDAAFDSIRNMVVLETQAEHFLKVLKCGSVCTNIYLRRIHNFALDMNWLPWPVLPKKRWPAIKFKEKGALEIGDGFALRARGFESGARGRRGSSRVQRPAVHTKALGQVFHFLDQDDIVRPSQLGNGPLPNWAKGGVFIKKLNHQSKIARGETLDLRQVVVQISRQPGQNGSAPTFIFVAPPARRRSPNKA